MSGKRREDAPAPLEQAEEAGIRAGIFRSGDRVAGDEMDVRPAYAAVICAMTEPLVEPTSVTIAPGFRCAAISAATRRMRRPAPRR